MMEESTPEINGLYRFTRIRQFFEILAARQLVEASRVFSCENSEFAQSLPSPPFQGDRTVNC